jgi:hypothetical protein
MARNPASRNFLVVTRSPGYYIVFHVVPSVASAVRNNRDVKDISTRLIIQVDRLKAEEKTKSPTQTYLADEK